MITLVSLSFNDILIFGTPALTAIFTYLLLNRGEDDEPQIVKGQDILRYVHCLSLFALLIITLYSVYIGHRPLIYFYIVAALFVTSVLYSMDSSERKHSKIIFLTALILAGSIPIALIVGNRFYPTYQWEHDSILQTGSLKETQEDAMKGGYYYIPIESLTVATIAFVIGPSQVVSLIYRASILIAAVVGVFALLRRLYLRSITGIIGAFFILSIPGLSLIGRFLPLLYIIFYILLTRLLYDSPHAIIGHFIVSLPMIFAHPSGFVIVIALFLPFALLRINNWPAKGMNSRGIMLSFITTIVVTFAYWIHTHLITLMAQTGVKFQSTISSYFSGVTTEEGAGPGGAGPGYTPRYYEQGYEIFAYAWSIPVALSAALLISTVLQLIREKRFDWSESLTLTSAFWGPLMIFLAYLTIPEGEVGDYLIPVGYFLLLLSSSVTATKLLTNRSKGHAIIAMALLFLFVLVGTYSPSLAPLEHPGFQTIATIHPYYTYLEAETVAPVLPAHATIYFDYDFPIGGGSYKGIQKVILHFISEPNPAQFARQPITLFVIREERFSKGVALDWNIVYSSGYHRIIAIQPSQ